MSLPHEYGLSEKALDRLAEALVVFRTLPSGVLGQSTSEDTVFGRFHLRGVLGQGRFGIVFLADDPVAGRQVALKVPQAGVLFDPALVDRFRRDVEAAGQLDHPGIVPVLETGSVHSVAYIVMPYIAGPTLAAWLTEHPQGVAIADAVGLAIALADAVQHAHERGVLHCDLKPANVLLSRRASCQLALQKEQAGSSLYDPKITDFGLARLLFRPAEETQTSFSAGTPPYMAPEQALGVRRDLTARCDVHALAAILYELLIGRPPYDGETNADRLRQLLDTEARPVSPRSRRGDISRDLEAIVLKGLEKEPARRYDSARGLGDDLRRFAEGRPTRARPVGPAGRAVRWARRRPAIALLVTACLLVTMLAAWQGYRGLRHAAELEWAARATASQEFNAGLERVRQRRLEQPDGWADDNLADLRRLAAMHSASDFQPTLCSEAAVALAAPRLLRVRELGVGKDAYVCAFAPDGQTLALGERFPRLPSNELRVWLVRTTGEDVGELRYPTDLAWERRLEYKRGDGARSIVYSPDGRWLVVGTRGGRLVRWDLRQKAPRPVAWEAHRGDGPDYKSDDVRSLVFNRDASVLLSGSYGQYVCRWDTRDGWKRLDRFPARLPVGTVPVQELVWLGKPDEPDELRLFDLRTGSFVLWAKVPRPVEFCQSPDGERLAVHTNLLGSNRLLLRPGAPSEELLLPQPVHLSRKAEIQDMVFSPDGRWLWFNLNNPNKLELWDAVRGTPVASAPIKAQSDRLAIQPGGQQVAVCGDEGAVLFETRESPGYQTLARPGEVDWFSLSPDGERLLIQAGKNPFEYPISAKSEIPSFLYLTLYQRTQTGLSRVQDLGAGVSGYPANRRVALDPTGTGSKLALCIGNGPHAGIFTPGATLHRTGNSHDLQYGSDGAVWLAVGGKLLRWTREGAARVVSAVSSDQDRAGVCFEVIRPERSGVLAGRRDGKVEWFDTAGKQLGTWAVFDDQEVSSLAMSADESEVLVGGSKGALARVSLPSGEVRMSPTRPHGDAVVGLEYLEGKVILTASADHTIRLWNGQGRMLLTLREAGPIVRVAISPGGAKLYVHVRGEWGLRIWDLAFLCDGLRDLGLVPGFSVTRQAPPEATPPTGGLMAEYFGYGCCLLERRRNSQVNFDWGEGQPSPWVGPDHISIRWTGWLHAPKSGDWEFQLDCDDEGTLWLDGRIVFQRVNSTRLPLPTATVSLPDRPVSFRLDYSEDTGPARCRLLWRPAGSAEPFTPVPPEAFTQSDRHFLP